MTEEKTKRKYVKKVEPSFTFTDAQYMARIIHKNTGVDIFHKTRLKQQVCARSMFNYILKKSHKWGLSRIAQFYRQNGYKGYDHATVYHSIKMYDIYVTQYPEYAVLFDDIAYAFNDEFIHMTSMYNKIRTLKQEQKKAVQDFVNALYKGTPIELPKYYDVIKVETDE